MSGFAFYMMCFGFVWLIEIMAKAHRKRMTTISMLVEMGATVEYREHCLHVEIAPERIGAVLKALAPELPAVVGLVINGRTVPIAERDV